MNFKEAIKAGIPKKIPEKKPFDFSVNHAPIREDILSASEKKLAIKNALRYFEKYQHKERSSHVYNLDYVDYFQNIHSQKIL